MDQSIPVNVAFPKVPCPRCGRMTTRIQVFDVPVAICLLYYFVWSTDRIIGCRRCVRSKMIKRLLLSIPLTNIFCWLFVPWHLGQLIVSYATDWPGIPPEYYAFDQARTSTNCGPTVAGFSCRTSAKNPAGIANTRRCGLLAHFRAAAAVGVWRQRSIPGAGNGRKELIFIPRCSTEGTCTVLANLGVANASNQPSSSTSSPQGQRVCCCHDSQQEPLPGPYGSPASYEKYARLIAEWQANGRQPPTPIGPHRKGGMSVDELILHYLNHAVGYYVKHGKPTGEFDNIRCALRSLRKLYGTTAAQEFGPKSLELVRQAMIYDGLARKTINGRVGRIKRTFRWASRNGLVPASIYHGLTAVEGLKRNRSAARETDPVTTVPEAHVQATLLCVNPHVGAMIQVQELAGMRPQDIRNLRTCDLDMTADVWIYRPWTHKTEHHGHDRQIAIGPGLTLLHSLRVG